MLKVRITWPLAIIIVAALIVWLVRPRATVRRSSARPAARPARESVIITPAREGRSPRPDYDAETERLDREAIESMRAASHRASRPVRMPRRSYAEETVTP
jgi:hypothetical protein